MDWINDVDPYQQALDDAVAATGWNKESQLIVALEYIRRCPLNTLARWQAYLAQRVEEETGLSYVR